MLDLRIVTPKTWLDVVFADFDSFLIDHACCERKASATGMSFVVRYPDRKALLEPMIEFAREELEHFHRVFKALTARGLVLRDDYQDEYVNQLRKATRATTGDPLVDGLLVAGIIEARSCERLKLVADALPDADPLKELYVDLARAEARHHALFFRLARQFESPERVRSRADQLLDFEATLIERLPHRAAVH